MKIKWLGQSCFLLTTRNGQKIVMDPYGKEVGFVLGLKLPNLEADIVTVSHDHSDHNNVGAVAGYRALLKDPGGFLGDGIEIKGVQTFHDNVSGKKRGNNVMFVFRLDGLAICHCGDLGHLLSQEQMDEIGKVDILMIPIGGKFTLDASGAAEVVKQLNPAVVIPMHYRTKTMRAPGFIFGTVDSFVDATKKAPREYSELDVELTNIKNVAEIAVLQTN